MDARIAVCAGVSVMIAAMLATSGTQSVFVVRLRNGTLFDTHSVAGLWTCQSDAGVTVAMKFGADGRFSRWDRTSDGDVSYGKGRWTVAGSEISYHMFGESCHSGHGNIPETSCTPIAISGGKMHIRHRYTNAVMLDNSLCYQTSPTAAVEMGDMLRNAENTGTYGSDDERQSQQTQLKSLIDTLVTERANVSATQQDEYDHMINQAHDALRRLQRGPQS